MPLPAMLEIHYEKICIRIQSGNGRWLRNFPLWKHITYTDDLPQEQLKLMKLKSKGIVIISIC